MKKTYTILEHQLLCLVQLLVDDHEETMDTLQSLLNEQDYDTPLKDANKLLEKHPCEQERRENDPVLVSYLTAEMHAKHAAVDATKPDMG